MPKHKRNSTGTGLGLGHGSNSKLPSLVEVEISTIAALGMQPGTRQFRLGRCNIFVSPPYPEAKMGWHMSISTPSRYPTWDEIAAARYALIPDEISMAMILPSKTEYVNIHNWCLHLHQE